MPDVPLTATFSAAMLLALPWIAQRDERFLPPAATMLGLAVLAKGLVPLALAAPLALRSDGSAICCDGAWRSLSSWWRLRGTSCATCETGAVFEGVFPAAPSGRFTSVALLHPQPLWFYLTLLPALMLPWTPLLLCPSCGRGWYREPRRRFLLAWFVFGLALFSTAANKFPGYVLPLLPAVGVLVALALEEIEDARAWLLACAVALVAFPIAVPLLPAAAANEWAAAPRPAFHWTWLRRQSQPRGPGFGIPGGSASRPSSASRPLRAAGLVYIKVRTEPQMEQIASARQLAAAAAAHAGEVCAGDINAIGSTD